MRSWHRCHADDCRRVETLAPHTTRAGLTTSCREASCEVLLLAQAAFHHELELLMNSASRVLAVCHSSSTSLFDTFLKSLALSGSSCLTWSAWFCLSWHLSHASDANPLACLLPGFRGRPSCLLASLRALITQVHSTVRRQRMCVGFNLFASSSLRCSKCSTRAKCGVPDTLARSR